VLLKPFLCLIKYLAFGKVSAYKSATALILDRWLLFENKQRVHI
jgi:hypothetical protein